MKKSIRNTLPGMMLLLVAAAIVIFARHYYHSRSDTPTVTVVNHKAESDDTSFVLAVSQILTYDFESPAGIMNENGRKQGEAKGGNWACDISPQTEFGPGILKPVSEIKQNNNVRQIEITCDAMAVSVADDAYFVITIDNDNGKNVLWQSKPFVFEKKLWTPQRFQFAIASNQFEPSFYIKLYVWNCKKQHFKIDNLNISFLAKTKPSFIVENIVSQKESNFFEGYEEKSAHTNIVTDKPYNGEHCMHMPTNCEYSPSITKKINEVWDDSLNAVQASVWIKCEEDNPSIVLVVNTKDVDGDELEWVGKSTKDDGWKAGEWKKLNARVNLKNDKRPVGQGSVSVYVWNKGKHNMWIDDFAVTFGAEKKRIDNGIAIDIAGMGAPKFYDNKYPLPAATLSPSSEIHTEALKNIVPNKNIFTGHFVSTLTDDIVVESNGTFGLFVFNNDNSSFDNVATVNTDIKNIMWAVPYRSKGATYLLCVDALRSKLVSINFSLQNNTVPHTAKASVRVVANTQNIGLTEFRPMPLRTAASSYIFWWNPQCEYIITQVVDAQLVPIARGQLPIANKVTLEAMVELPLGYTPFQYIAIAKNGKQHTAYTLKYSEELKSISTIAITNAFFNAQVNENVQCAAIGHSPLVLWYNDVFRNDFKLVKADTKGINVSHQLDFVATNAHNPKYYECIRILPLSLASKGNYVLVSCANCEAFDSNNRCIKLESIQGLENVTELYKINISENEVE